MECGKWKIVETAKDNNIQQQASYSKHAYARLNALLQRGSRSPLLKRMMMIYIQLRHWVLLL